MYTTGTAFLEALQEAGVEYIFANLGSDHPAMVEAIAEAAVDGRPIPKVITCPNEMVALSAAHGYAQTTGRAQAVVVHVECGTQALAGAVHNAAKGRIPVLIFAGASPYTQEGELKGSRNEFIQWIQDVPDQRGLVRGYVKYENEIRTGRNVKQLVHRAMQFAHSEPRGPVYLVGGREAMEEVIEPVRVDTELWQPVAPCALAPEGLQALAADLAKAKRPLIVTSYVGRNAKAVDELKKLSEHWAIGVLESVPNYMNFPTTNPMYQGNQWNDPVQNDALAAADFVLVVDSDVPWIPLVSKPSAEATVYYIDTDPLKQQMPLWYIPARRAFRADAGVALAQLNEALAGHARDAGLLEERRRHYAARHEAWRARLDALEAGRADVITPEFLTARVREALDEDCIVMSEGISNYQTIVNHLKRERTGSLFTSGGGSLGWQGGAALGARLAHPGKTVVTLSGDGSYMFAVPSSVHWMSRRYEAPILQVVYNNRGWKSPKLSALAVHPDGHASRAAPDVIGVSFDPPSDYAGIAAAAGGALGLTVKHPGELDAALAAALRAVREEGRSAVIDVWLPEL